MKKRKDYASDVPRIDVKTGKIDDACARYNLGRASMRRVAEDAGAVVRIGRAYLINFDKVDQYMDSISGQ